MAIAVGTKFGPYEILTLAPDGSAIFAPDIGTQEIYALAIKWP